MAIIHPMWAMDEYAKIFRVWVWLRPPQAPMVTDIIAMIVVNLVSKSPWI